MRDIVLVTVDSLRADHVGCYGYDRDTTPVIDDLATDGRRFTNVFAHACSTRPSFPSILTSSYALMYGGFERLSSKRTTLAEAIRNAGYQTAGFHSNLYLSADFGYDRGFDQFYDSKSDPSPLARARQAVKTHLDQNGVVYNVLQKAFNATERRTGVELGSAYVPADEMTDMALEWARKADDGPRFLWVHYMDVHHPYTPPARYQRQFRDDPVDNETAIRLRRKMLEDPDRITDDELNTLLDLYDAEIAFVDAEVDRLLKGLQDTWETDPVIAFTADHGEEFLDHGQFSHAATFYDEVLHVPLILHDGESSGTVDDLVGLLDLAPTLVDYADASEPDTFLGESLVSGHEHDREQVIAEWADYDEGDRRFALRTNEWKYVQMEGGEERLFDLTSDPEETTNVAEEYPGTLSTFRDKIENHANSVGSESISAEMDEEVRQRLRDLGYQE
ncbi:sulfatase [Natribaculum luteum]|uniref:Sulfatase n=1 Tax=Natribaculum luteum TaxID=1586232 RepID=A0ABD5NU91_9EURY|nr:sulfatase [Natribaculum luteum]